MAEGEDDDDDDDEVGLIRARSSRAVRRSAGRTCLNGQRDGVPREVLQVRSVADVSVALAVDERRGAAVPGPEPPPPPGERPRVDLQHLAVARDGQRDQYALQRVAHVVRDPRDRVGGGRTVPGHVPERVDREQQRGDLHVQVQLQRAFPVHLQPGLLIHLQAHRGPGGQPAPDQRVDDSGEQAQRRHGERHVVDGLLEKPGNTVRVIIIAKARRSHCRYSTDSG